jgi:hypothetical protein
VRRLPTPDPDRTPTRRESIADLDARRWLHFASTSYGPELERRVAQSLAAERPVTVALATRKWLLDRGRGEIVRYADGQVPASD